MTLCSKNAIIFFKDYIMHFKPIFFIFYDFKNIITPRLLYNFQIENQKKIEFKLKEIAFQKQKVI